MFVSEKDVKGHSYSKRYILFSQGWLYNRPNVIIFAAIYSSDIEASSVTVRILFDYFQ